ncbi:MAG: DUF6468 domain-containing protein [Pseudomonadota bacterium]
MIAANALDLIVVVLLIAGGAGGYLISRRLHRLMAAQEELKSALSSFDAATLRADAALKRLEAGGIAKGSELNSAAKRAEALIAELSVMTSAGERIADRIEGAVKDVRQLGAARKTQRAA